MDDRTFDAETAAGWIRMVEAPGSRRETEIYPRLRDWLGTAGDVLEIGAGQGICSAQIQVGRYTGLEPSPFLVERARELYAGEFVVGNVYAMPFADGSFEAVFAVLVWHLLSDLSGAALELARVLRPGGRFLLITANPDQAGAWEGLYRECRRDGPRLEGTLASGERDVLFLHSRGELVASLEAAGLAVTRVETLWSEVMLAVKGSLRNQELASVRPRRNP